MWEIAWELLPYRSLALRRGWEFIAWLAELRARAERAIGDDLARAIYA